MHRQCSDLTFAVITCKELTEALCLACAAAEDPIKKTLLQLQKTFTVDGVTTPLGPKDVEASRLYPDYFYTPIAKYMNNLIDTFRTQLAAEE